MYPYTRTMTGGALPSPTGSTSSLALFSRWRVSPSLPIRVLDPDVSPLVAYIIQPFVVAAAAGCARRCELHLATLFSRTYTHTHRETKHCRRCRQGTRPRTRCFSHRDGYTPRSNATAKSRCAARYLHHNSDFFFYRFLACRYLSLSSSPAGASSPHESPLSPSLARALARSHSFRSRPCVYMSHTASPPPLRPVNTKHAGRRTDERALAVRNETRGKVARARGVDVFPRVFPEKTAT